jgi:hypothetical protein
MTRYLAGRIERGASFNVVNDSVEGVVPAIVLICLKGVRVVLSVFY